MAAPGSGGAGESTGGVRLQEYVILWWRAQCIYVWFSGCLLACSLSTAIVGVPTELKPGFSSGWPLVVLLVTCAREWVNMVVTQTYFYNTLPCMDMPWPCEIEISLPGSGFLRSGRENMDEINFRWVIARKPKKNIQTIASLDKYE